MAKYSLIKTITLISCLSCSNESNSDVPNFIFYITDDISFDDFGCYGNSFVKTPATDQLAREGLVFDNAYLTVSSCSPSRNSIITGRYPHNTGAPELHTHLPENQLMFPELLKEAGYYTVLSGKNHMGPAVQRAFDTISPGSGPGYQEDWIELLSNRPKNKPFFFWLASFDAHRPWETDDKGIIYHPDSIEVPPMMYDGPLTRQDLAHYYHEVSRVDYYLGEIRKELERQNISDNTYIIFCSDNGRPFPRCKMRLYDSGIKTPLIVYGPEVSRGRTNSLVSSIDISVTLLELAGIQKDERIQGVSLTPILSNPNSTVRDFAFAERNWHVYQGHERMVRFGNWLYIRNSFPNKRAFSPESSPGFPAGKELLDAYLNGQTNKNQEDIFIENRPAEELYLVSEDPYQFNNLSNEINHKDTLMFLSAILDDWIHQTGDHVPDPITTDRETYDYNNQRYENWKGHQQMAGTLLGADTITHPGPIRLSDD